MATAQDDCEFLSTESPHHSLTLQPFPLPHSTHSIICDVSHGHGTPCPVVPPSFRRLVFNALHRLSHPGIKPTQKLISSRGPRCTLILKDGLVRVSLANGPK